MLSRCGLHTPTLPLLRSFCFFTFHPLCPQPHLFSSSLCKSSSALLPCNSHFFTQASPYQCPKHALKPGSHDVSPLTERLHDTPKQATRFGSSRKTSNGFSLSSLDNKRVDNNLVKTSGSAATVNKSDGKKTSRLLDSSNRRKKESGFAPDRAKDGNSATNSLDLSNAEEGNGKVEGKSVKGGQRNQDVKGKKGKRSSNKSKDDTVDTKIRFQFEMCSKAGDVMGAISLYDSATKEGIKLGQYHYTMILYLCSSAALGVVRPAKSGSGSRSLQMLVPSNRGTSLNSVNGAVVGEVDRIDSGDLFESEESFDEEEDEGDDEEEDDAYSDPDMKEQNVRQKGAEILVSESVKKYALERGYEVYERMCLESIPMNEAALTSVARMAMAMGDGDKAFDMVKQMKALGINPKLRSYGPALSVFCSQGEVEKAFEVERHMLDHGVQPEEPELEALFRVCVDAGKPDKIYYLLHKLRTAVRSVSPSTADLIQKWFESIEASRVGKRKWDQKTIIQTMESVGGGWHGLGWLGSGKWSVSRNIVEDDGSCKCCGEKLALIDLDPKETEKFAESVAAIASKREKNSSFQKFQRWLEYYGPFEAIVDAANVGLFSQRTFRLSKVKAVVNGIRQMLTSRKWPLVVLHNRRISDPKMDEPMNSAIIERWKTADALYATPTGSNDDWYWLYAAIKYKCLLVTNDEMRDHIFQLLGNDFFPRWKERHQVRFSFSEVGPVFHMPPPCSVVIQESERGNWHIPVVSKHQSEGERTWLCIRRIKSGRATKQDHLDSMTASIEFKEQDNDDQHANSSSETEDEREDEQRPAAKQAQKTYGRNKIATPESVFPSYWSILADLESAEEQSGTVIDFQI